MNLIEKIIKKINLISEKIYTQLNKFRFKKFGKNSLISFGCTINNPKLIEIEENVYIGNQVWLNAEKNNNFDDTKLFIKSGSHISRFSHINAFNKVIIEENVLIAENVYLGDTDHDTSRKDIAIIKQGNKIKGQVIIKKGSFICRNVVINAGVTIGEFSIVAPNTLVSHKSIPPNSLVVGNPSRVFKRKFK